MKKSYAALLVILAGVLWGSSGLFVHILAPLGYSSAHMTAIRSGTAAIGMLFYSLLFKRELFRVRKIDLCIFALSAIGLFGTGACYFFSMQASSVATAVVLMYTAPVYVMIFSAIFFGEKLSGARITALVLMLAGAALVSGVAGEVSFSLSGILMGILAGISYGAYNILTKLSLRRGASVLSSNIYVFCMTALISLFFASPASLIEVTKKAPAYTPLLLAALGVITFLLPYLCYTYAMKRLDATTTASLGIAEPLSASLFGIFLLGEEYDAYIILGVVLILAAILLTCKDGGREQSSQNKS